MKKYIKSKKGFSLIELIICIGGLLSLLLLAFIIYIGIHFIMKFW